MHQNGGQPKVVQSMMYARIGTLALCILAAGQAGSAEEPQAPRLVAEFDCTRDYPAETYFAHGAVSVAESPIGAYREAEGRPLSRFGYRFQVENTGRPHVAVVRYPDDKRRFMCVMDGTCYDLTTGVYTDFEHPVSGEMLEIRRIFWPRWTDCSIVFMTWSDGEPAAAADIKIFELPGLPPLDVPGDPHNGSRRELGIQFEDPCGTCASAGAITHADWVDRMAAYARHSGQNLLVYPVVWYHGPLYPSEREPSGNFNTVVAPDRKQYCRWTTQPADWVEEILERFDAEGLDFQAAVTLLRLGTLMQRMNIDLESIKAGGDTINNMLGSDQVQAGTQDWTPLYNVLNFPDQVAGTFDGWAYGELSGQPYRAGPIFNPLHPVVQDAVVGLAEEIAGRYRGHPSFKGISFNLWHATILWYASLDAGYDDYTIGLFTRETGIEVPVDPRAPDRFSKRHAFLTGERRKEWVDWRCAKIHALFCRIRDAVVAQRPDLRVTITLWTETTVAQILGLSKTPGHQLYARQSTADLYRDGGFDIALYQSDPNIEVDLCFTPARDRDGWGTSGVNMALEESAMFRDHDFLDAATLNAAYAQTKPGVFIFNSWVEAWGTHTWFPCEADDAQAQTLAFMSGKPAEGIFRINSTYPEDGFWWDSQLRITPPLPAGEHFMEHYAHALAELDACRITRGGLFLESVNTERIQRFARAYRALPATKFNTVGGSTDPVAVRSLVHEGRQFLYLVNRDYYPVAVELALSGPAKVTELATQQVLDAPSQWAMTLGPYELRSFALDSGVTVGGFTAAPPPGIVSQLQKDAEIALARFERLKAANAALPIGADRMEADIRAAVDAGRYAWLRRALHGYIVRKCEQLTAAME